MDLRIPLLCRVQGATGSVWLRTPPPAPCAAGKPSGIASTQPSIAAPSAAPVALADPAASANPSSAPVFPDQDAMMAGAGAAPLFGGAAEATQPADLKEHFQALVRRPCLNLRSKR